MSEQGENKASRYNLTEIKDALRLLVEPGGVFEVRAFHARIDGYRRAHTEAGYFTDIDKAAAAVARLSGNAECVCITLNTIDPNLLARIAHRIKVCEKSDALTSEKEVIRRRWFLIDCDAKRCSHVSATDAERNVVLSRAWAIRKSLMERSWPAPVFADSGNGAHLLFRIDLPNDPASSDLLRGCIEALKARFEDEQVLIDTSVVDAGQLLKVYGTMACKGDSTEDRPHRLARMLAVPEQLTVVSRELLENLAASRPGPPESGERQGRSRRTAPPPQEAGRTTKGAGTSSGRASQNQFDLPQWIAEHCLEVDGPGDWEDGQKWVFLTCPWDSSHTNRSAYIVQHANGAIAAGCHHNSCHGKDWHALRDVIEPGWRERSGRERRPDPGHMHDDDGPGLPEIEVYNRQQRDISDRAIAALASSNDPPRLFRQSGAPVRLAEDENGRVQIDRLDTISLRAELGRVATWLKTDRSGQKNIPPPRETAEDLLGRGDWFVLPPLTGLITSPCFDADGALIVIPGYHRPSGLLYRPAPGDAPITPPPLAPTNEDVEAARSLIVKTILGDFPFNDSASLAHAIALLILPFVREMIRGQTPLHLFDAPTEGTGKGLLADALTIPFKPDGISIRPAPTEEAEWRKTLTSVLRDAPSHVLFDNINHPLGSAALCAALTAPIWEDRLLGVSADVKLPIRCAWAVTGNNLSITSEIARRSVWIRLDARCERPSQRTGFAIGDLRQWAREHRPRIVEAALTLVQAWIAAGKPVGERTIGSFEAWSRVMGGILHIAGIEGFLDNLHDLYTEADTEGEEWRAFIAVWWEQLGTSEVGVSELFGYAEMLGLLGEQIGSGNDRASRTRFGSLLRSKTDRIYAGKRIQLCRTVQRLKKYRLVEVPGDGVPPGEVHHNFVPGGGPGVPAPATHVQNGGDPEAQELHGKWAERRTPDTRFVPDSRFSSETRYTAAADQASSSPSGDTRDSPQEADAGSDARQYSSSATKDERAAAALACRVEEEAFTKAPDHDGNQVGKAQLELREICEEVDGLRQNTPPPCGDLTPILHAIYDRVPPGAIPWAKSHRPELQQAAHEAEERLVDANELRDPAAVRAAAHEFAAAYRDVVQAFRREARVEEAGPDNEAAESSAVQ
jgi:hypothetical protein